MTQLEPDILVRGPRGRQAAGRMGGFADGRPGGAPCDKQPLKVKRDVTARGWFQTVTINLCELFVSLFLKASFLNNRCVLLLAIN